MAEAVISIKEGLAYITKKGNRQAVASWLQSAISLFCHATAAAAAALIRTSLHWAASCHASAWRVRCCAKDHSLSRCACCTRLCSSGSMPCLDRYSTAHGVHRTPCVPAWPGLGLDLG